MALLRRMEASIVGCDDQLVHLRSYGCKQGKTDGPPVVQGPR